MTDNDERLVASFFEQHKQAQLEDNGFTERVMRRLPQEYSRMVMLNRIWTAVCTAASVALFVMADGFTLVKNVATNFLADAMGSLLSVSTSPASAAMIVTGALAIGYVALYNTLATD